MKNFPFSSAEWKIAEKKIFTFSRNITSPSPLKNIARLGRALSPFIRLVEFHQLIYDFISSVLFLFLVLGNLLMVQ
jgi:hypothetical protein